MKRLCTILIAVAGLAYASEPDDVVRLISGKSHARFSFEFLDDLSSPVVVSNVTTEINARSTRQSLAQAMSIDTNQVLLPSFSVTNYSLHCYRNGADQRVYNAVKFRMYWYAASRFDGHSLEYAQTNLVERGSQTYRSAKSLQEQALRHHQDCPPSWIKAGPGEKEFHVRDGNTAWIYHPAVSIGWPALDYFGLRATKHDPKELDPTFPALLKQVRKEAEANLAARGIKRQMGYCHALWGEMDDIFEKKHDIRWRSPAEQNPDVIYD